MKIDPKKYYTIKTYSLTTFDIVCINCLTYTKYISPNFSNQMGFNMYISSKPFASITNPKEQTINNIVDIYINGI